MRIDVVIVQFIDTAQELRQTIRLAEQIHKRMGSGHFLREYFDVVYDQLPKEDDLQMREYQEEENTHADKLDIVSQMERKDITMDGLVQLNYHVKSEICVAFDLID